MNFFFDIPPLTTGYRKYTIHSAECAVLLFKTFNMTDCFQLIVRISFSFVAPTCMKSCTTIHAGTMLMRTNNIYVKQLPDQCYVDSATSNRMMYQVQVVHCNELGYFDSYYIERIIALNYI